MAKLDGMFERCINICSAGKLFSATGIRVVRIIKKFILLKKLILPY